MSDSSRIVGRLGSVVLPFCIFRILSDSNRSCESQSESSISGGRFGRSGGRGRGGGSFAFVVMTKMIDFVRCSGSEFSQFRSNAVQ